MGVRGADDDDAVDVCIADQLFSRRICLRYVEFFRNGRCQRAIDVRDGDDGSFGNARRQVPDVNFAEPSRADDAYFELRHKWLVVGSW
jgi:hypothetical protein